MIKNLQDPKNIDNIIKRNRDTYDSVAKEYYKKSSERISFNEKIIDRFAKYITTGKSVLDIGCAVGIDLKIFKQKGFIPTGIDFSPKMLFFARKLNPGIQIIEGDFLDVEFNEPFDAIFAQSFIHLFPKAIAVNIIKKIYDLLKNGGVAYITTTKSTQSDNGNWIEKSDYRGNFKRFRRLWTEEELQKTIQSVGFQIVDFYEISDPFKKMWAVFTAKK